MSEQFNKQAADVAATIATREKSKIAVFVAIKDDGSIVVIPNPALSYEDAGNLLFKAAVTCKGRKEKSGLFIPKTGLS